MARGPKKWDEATVERMRLEGRGKGEGRHYKPWIGVLEFSSRGRSRRVAGVKTGREHQLFSDVEWGLFLLLEWARNVIDIREQFPLDRELTLEIAAMLRIHHPVYPGTKVPAVMTVDFLATEERNGSRSLVAYNAKRTEEAEDARSLEKLEIQRYYFQGIGSPHHLVFSSQIPANTVRNLAWIRGGLLKPGELEPYPNCLVENAQRMAADLAHPRSSQSLCRILRHFRHPFRVTQWHWDARCTPPDAKRVLTADLESPDLASAPLAAFRVADIAGQLHHIRFGT